MKDMKRNKARNAFLEAVKGLSLDEIVEWEGRVLGAGEEFLPEEARLVRDDQPLTTEAQVTAYYEFY